MENCKNKFCVETKKLVEVFRFMKEASLRAARAGKALREAFLEADREYKRLRNRRKRGKR